MRRRGVQAQKKAECYCTAQKKRSTIARRRDGDEGCARWCLPVPRPTALSPRRPRSPGCTAGGVSWPPVASPCLSSASAWTRASAGPVNEGKGGGKVIRVGRANARRRLPRCALTLRVETWSGPSCDKRRDTISRWAFSDEDMLPSEAMGTFSCEETDDKVCYRARLSGGVGSLV